MDEFNKNDNLATEKLDLTYCRSSNDSCARSTTYGCGDDVDQESDLDNSSN